MKATSSIAIAILAALAATIPPVAASGLLGIYGIVEKVVLEPNAREPERIQIWGVFSYVDGAGEGQSGAVSNPACGYLYFQLPSTSAGYATASTIVAIRNEWADLKAVAGTGQAIGFGRWGYIASFESLDPRNRQTPPSTILQARGDRYWDTNAHVRVRGASERPGDPAVYQTNTGIVKLTEPGSHAWVVRMLRGALRPDSGCAR